MFNSIKETIKKYDLFLIICSVISIITGLIFVFSATKSMNSIKFIIVQIFALLIGIALLYIITKINYEDIADLWKLISVISISLLIIVLILGTGKESTGTKGWIRIAGIGIQPAELVKIGFIITLSKHLSVIGDEVNYIKNVMLLILHLSLPVGLIMLQPDAGTSMVFLFIFIILIYISGIDKRYITFGFISFISGCIFSWFFLLSTYQKERIFAFLNPEAAPVSYGYHVLQSKISIGSGQLFGKGYLEGIQTQLGILPEKHTDFIFAVIGEEGGFIMALITVFVLFALVIRTIYISSTAKNPLGKYLCLGVASMWLFHIFENIGMTIGLMPVTGIPLPFVSYGGSSLITNCIALGIVLNVNMRKKTLSFE